MARQRIEPFLWSLFSSGGMVAALLLPALVFLFGVAFPLGWLSEPSYGSLADAVRFPLTRLVLLGLFVLGLFHWAHRFRYTLYEGLQLKHLSLVITVFCYGGALAGSLVSAWLLLISL